MARHISRITIGSQLLLPFILVYLVFIYDTQSCMSGMKSTGVTYPQGDIAIEYGQPLEIYCILNADYIDKYGPDAIKNITFVRNGEPVPEEMITIVNTSTIRLYVEKPPLSVSMYYCKENIAENAVCLNSVIVGTKPQEVTDFSCVSHNYENMTCLWTAPQNYVKTNYSLIYHFQGRNSRGYYNCPKIEPSSTVTELTPMKCFWALSTQPLYRQSQQIYFITLQASNKFGNMSIKYNFTHFANVIPEPPYNLTIDRIDKTTESILLRWSVPRPIRSFPPGVVHRIVYRSEFDNNNTWTTANTSMLAHKESTYAYNLTGLPYAHALYDIRISSRSVKALASDERMWSRFASITARTVSKLPATPPLTNIGSFEIVNGLTHRDIIIYWQYIPDQMKNGENVTYQVISVLENSTEKTLIPDEVTNTYAKFNSLSLLSYSFTIATANEIGLSKNVSHVYVPAYVNRVPEPTGFAKIAFPQSTYELSWVAPVVQDGDEPIENYTIFWCNNDRDRPYQCKGYLQWIEVEPHYTSYNITVSETQYQFAISANTKHASSGMVWASCTVILNGGIGKMKNLWIDRLGSNFIHITWVLGCSDRIAGIEGFKIYYCPIISPVELTCKESEKVQTIDDPTATEGNVTNLRPYTTYMLTVSVVTKHNSNSLQSERLYNTTLEGIPDSPPQNVRVANVTNSTFTVVWSPPTRMNGVLRYYEISYKTNYPGGHTKKLEPVTEKNLPEMEQNIVLDKLKSYTQYTITIKACTVSCSAPSSPLTVRTAVSMPGKMREPSINNPNVSLIQISWIAPDVRGGEINFYELRIKEKTSEENTTRIINTTDLRYTIPNCHDESNGVFFFSVRAVNVDKGKKYTGPWSPETVNYCQPAPGYILYIFIGILFVITLILALIYAIKSLWKRCKLMRDVEVKLPPGLAPPDMNLHSWPESGLSGKGQGDGHTLPDADPDADEQLLLDRKADGGISGDSSGCSSGQESVISSLASGTNLSSGMDSGTEQPKTPSDEGVIGEGNSSREGSLRLRKPGYTASYCVLGVSGAPESDAGRGYVPVPKTNFSSPDARRMGSMHSPYVIAVDPKHLVAREKSPTAEIGYSSVVPTSTLINIDPGALPFEQASPANSIELSPDIYVKTDRSMQPDSLASDYLLNSYCRLGLDGKNIIPSLPLADAADLITDTLDTVDQPVARPIRSSEAVKGYVPHKHFDSKMLKGD